MRSCSAGNITPRNLLSYTQHLTFKLNLIKSLLFPVCGRVIQYKTNQDVPKPAFHMADLGFRSIYMIVADKQRNPSSCYLLKQSTRLILSPVTLLSLNLHSCLSAAWMLTLYEPQIFPNSRSSGWTGGSNFTLNVSVFFCLNNPCGRHGDSTWCFLTICQFWLDKM